MNDVCQGAEIATQSTGSNAHAHAHALMHTKTQRTCERELHRGRACLFEHTTTSPYPMASFSCTRLRISRPAPVCG